MREPIAGSVADPEAEQRDRRGRRRRRAAQRLGLQALDDVLATRRAQHHPDARQASAVPSGRVCGSREAAVGVGEGPDRFGYVLVLPGPLECGRVAPAGRRVFYRRRGVVCGVSRVPAHVSRADRLTAGPSSSTGRWAAGHPGGSVSGDRNLPRLTHADLTSRPRLDGLDGPSWPVIVGGARLEQRQHALRARAGPRS